MILELFVVLNALGFAAWILGSVFSQVEVAVIGGIIIVGAGVMVIGTGLEYRSGQVRDHQFRTVNNTTVTDNVTVTQEWQQASLPQELSLGFLIVLLGSSALYRSLDNT